MRKELADTVSNRAFLIALMVLLIGMVIAGISAGNARYSGTIIESMSLILPTRFFDLLVINNQAILINSLGVLIAVAYDFNSINKERTEGSMKILLSYPIFRDRVIIGKMLSGLIMIIVIIGISLSIGLVVFLLTANLIPTISMMTRFSMYIIFSILLLWGWLGLSIFLSSYFKETKTTLLILLLLVGISNSEVQSYFMTTISRLVYGSNNPIYYNVWLIVQHLISPSTIYSGITESLSISSMLSWLGNERILKPIVISELLINNIYSVLLLVATPILTFAASYTVFMRRDIQ